MTSDEILRRGRIGRWRVVRLINEGTFGWVFEIADPKSGKRHALKLLKPEAAKGEEYRRFWKEGTILAAQNDPHLVSIVMSDTDDELGVEYYIMELLTGRDLAQLLKAEGELPIKRVVSIFLGALQGLGRLHAARPLIIHRDVKPGNIYITDEGRAKIIDLGIATTQRSREDDTVAAVDDTYTTTALFKGTPKYASPEHLQVLDLDTSSDVFSMGLCLFEALEGRHPYSDQPDIPTVTYQSVLSYYARLEGSRKQVSLDFQRTPEPIQSVVRKALSLHPSDRYRNAGEMREALARAAKGQAVAPTPDPTGTQPRTRRAPPRPVRAPRRWVPVAASAAGVVLLAVGAGTWWWVSRGDEGTNPVEVTEEVAPQVVEKALPSGPTPEQTTLREDATRVAEEVERLLGEGVADADDAARVRQSRLDGEKYWTAQSFPDAERAYRAARVEGNQVIDLARRGALAQDKLAVEQAREQARLENAELNAAAEWSGAEGLREQAQRAESESRSADAAQQYASARAGYEGAFAQAEKAVADAQTGEKSARSARARLPGNGDCGRLGDPPARTACEAGARALTEGSGALAAKNAPPALRSFRVAREQFEKAARLIPRNSPPTLRLEPSGSLALVLGQSATIRARTQDKEDQAVGVEFTIRQPGGHLQKRNENPFVFHPESAGDYTIEAIGTDAAGLRSKTAQLVASVQPGSPPTTLTSTTMQSFDDDAATAVKETLEEYVNAVENYDLETLSYARTILTVLGKRMQRCIDRGGALAATVTALGPPKPLDGGRRFEQRASQLIHCVDHEGKRDTIAEGSIVAKVSHRKDGWYLDQVTGN